MSALSNVIERFIVSLIKSSEDGVIEIQRNEMAQHFECAPSQINYVLSTRFTPYKGYYIESRRGGGGYIKIVKVDFQDFEEANKIIMDSIGNSITKLKAYHLIDGIYEEGIISDRERNIMKIAVSDTALPLSVEERNRARALVLKNMILLLFN